MNAREHWDHIYATKAADQVSWFAPHLADSLALIERAAGSVSAAIIDVGGGASSLVDDLLAHGYQHLTVLDISQAAIDAGRKRLGIDAKRVRWIAADITDVQLDSAQFDVWHDRAVFHFLTAPAQRAAYVGQVTRILKPGGHIVVGTFGTEGPTRCSGLDVIHHDADSLRREFGPQFRLMEDFIRLHRTPAGAVQQFLYCHFVLE
ncbi:MAG TPA: class I SAM-dependent methyltransferase [Terracidiphilus sp.]|nr:class I SAM-dependent methyltransferase [Terracidiphilus sp.]